MKLTGIHCACCADLERSAEDLRIFWVICGRIKVADKSRLRGKGGGIANHAGHQAVQ